MKFFAVSLAAAALAAALEAAVIQDPLTGTTLDPARWQAGRMGEVTATADGVHLVGGEGENAAALTFKTKVSPDTPYNLQLELKPLAAENRGYAVLIGAPGWFVANRGDGGFWLQTDEGVVGSTEALPMDRWYRLDARNRRGVVHIRLTDDAGHAVGEWTATKGAGQPGSISAVALAGANQPGPRGMLVRQWRLELLDDSACVMLPEDDTAWLDARLWTVGGAPGTLTNPADGSLRAELNPGAILSFRFPEPIRRRQLVEVNLELSLQTGDDSYNLSYMLKGAGDGYIYWNKLNLARGFNAAEVIVNTELAPVFGTLPDDELREFQIGASFLETPFQITITRFQLTTVPETTAAGE